jgi:hypothetical protein
LVGASPLLSTIEYYRSKDVQLVGDVMRGESQALLDEYVKRTAFRRHLASNAKA